jgi:hypothetical protein
MKNTHALTALSLLNLGILIFIVSHHTASVQASGSEQMVRGRALEIVDGRGRVRASISINPEWQKQLSQMRRSPHPAGPRFATFLPV